MSNDTKPSHNNKKHKIVKVTDLECYADVKTLSADTSWKLLFVLDVQIAAHMWSLSLKEETNLFVMSRVVLRKIISYYIYCLLGTVFLVLRFAVPIWRHFSRQFVLLG